MISILESPTKVENNRIKTRSIKDQDKTPQLSIKRDYQHISKEKKVQLIQTVLKQKCRIKKIAKDLQINYATAKTILHTYRKKQTPFESVLPQNTAGISQIQGNSEIHMIVKVCDKMIREYEYFGELKSLKQ